MRECQAFISYKDSFIQMEEIGGIGEGLVLFNPEEKEEGLDYKIHFANTIFLKDKGSALIPIGEVELPFCIINSDGKQIFCTEEPNEEFVTMVFQRMEDEVQEIVELNWIKSKR